MLATTITLNLETIVVILGILGVIFGWLSKLNTKENQLIRRLDQIDNNRKSSIESFSNRIENAVESFKSSLQIHKGSNELEFYKLRASILMLKTHQENIEKYLEARQGYQPRKSGFTNADFLGEENESANY